MLGSSPSHIVALGYSPLARHLHSVTQNPCLWCKDEELHQVWCTRFSAGGVYIQQLETFILVLTSSAGFLRYIQRGVGHSPPSQSSGHDSLENWRGPIGNENQKENCGQHKGSGESHPCQTTISTPLPPGQGGRMRHWVLFAVQGAQCRTSKRMRKMKMNPWGHIHWQMRKFSNCPMRDKSLLSGTGRSSQFLVPELTTSHSSHWKVPHPSS